MELPELENLILLFMKYSFQRNPLFLWDAINFCHKKELPFPPWVRKGIGNISDKLLHYNGEENFDTFLKKILNLNADAARKHKKERKYARLYFETLINFEECTTLEKAIKKTANDKNESQETVRTAYEEYGFAKLLKKLELDPQEVFKEIKYPHDVFESINKNSN